MTLRDKGTIYGLYCVCSRCDGSIRYVGQTTQTVERRLSAHRSNPKKERNTLKGRWVQSHGGENIRSRVLEVDPPEGLDEAEIKWVEREGTLNPKGLNLTPGGYDGAGRPGSLNPSAKLTEDQVVEIIHKISSDVSQTSRTLAQEYGVTKTLILKIDQGELWPEVDRPYGVQVLGKRSVKRPMTREVAREIRAVGGEGVLTRYEIADRFGVSYAAVSNILAMRTWREDA